MRALVTAIFSLTLMTCALAQANVAVLNVNKADDATYTSILKAAVSEDFQLNRGKILVDAKVNGKSGKYLLDTGAGAFIINEAPESSSDFKVVGLNQDCEAEPTTVELQWGEQLFEELPGYKVDLQALENSMGLSLDGIIGHSMLSKGALLIDYQAEDLTFMPSPNPKKLRKEGWKAHHVFLVNHLLTIGLKINGQKVFLGLDTGAEINLLVNASDIELLESGTQITGIDNIEKKALKVDLQSVNLKNRSIEIGDLFYSPSDFFKEQFGNELSGLLGFPFFANNPFILDLNNKVLYLKQ